MDEWNDYDDYCYECTVLGDDYSYDLDTDDLVCNCFDCEFFNGGSDD